MLACCRGSGDRDASGAYRSNRGMGSSASAAPVRPPSPPPPNALDSRLPFNPREAFKLKNYWKVINRKMSEAGIEMIIRLLTTNPDYRKYATFAEFGKDESQMRSSEELEVFGTSVLMAIDKMVASFDDVDAGVAHLQSVGKLHAKLDGFTPNMFANMKDAFMYAASVAFEDRYNDQVEQCFQTLFDFCIKYMQEGLQS